jgi:Flp pilus assembly pilin Flp
MSKSFISQFVADESGQGITEYGAILAFVAVLVAIMVGVVQGGLKSAISESFSTIVSQLNALNKQSSAAS